MVVQCHDCKIKTVTLVCRQSYQLHGCIDKMGSKFFRWFSKHLQKKTYMTDSTDTPQKNGELPVSPQKTDSVVDCLDLQKNVEENEAVEEQSVVTNELGFDLGHSKCTSPCRLVSAGDCSNVKPGSAYYETDMRCDEVCSTHESSQASFHTEMSENAQAENLESQTPNSLVADTCGASVIYDVYSDLSSSSSALVCVNSDLLPMEPSVYSGLTAGEIAMIENYVEIHLNRMCPTSYYDFCLITCDVDYEEATVFRSDFSREYNLTGCMLFDDDIAGLGKDIFEQYEEMMERSTKVFFYHTENYKKDNVHRRVQNGAVYQQLWEKMYKDKDKCVPVFPNGSRSLGLALSGVSGLDPTLPEHMRRRVLATFTDRIRKVRRLKEAEANRKRSVLYKELFQSVAQNFKERKDFLTRQGESVSMESQLAINEEGMRRHELEVSPFSNIEISHLKPMLTSLAIEDEAKNRIYELVSESCTKSLANDSVSASHIQPSQNNSSSGVSISKSSNIQIGPRIELNVHINRTGETNSYHDIDSEDDS